MNAKSSRQFQARKLYMLATAACLVSLVWTFALFFQEETRHRRALLKELVGMEEALEVEVQPLRNATNRLGAVKHRVDQYAGWLEARNYWGSLLGELRNVLLQVEEDGEKAFSTSTGIWIAEFDPIIPGKGTSKPPAKPPPHRTGPPAWSARNLELNAQPDPSIRQIRLRCKIVDLSRLGWKANSDFAYMFDRAISNSSWFLPNGTKLGNLQPAGDGHTFRFEAILTLNRPIRF
jgi:hypothetical protein